MIFTKVTKDNLPALCAFIERNALFGVSVAIDVDLMTSELVRLSNRYGLTVYLRVKGWDNIEGGLVELMDQPEFNSVVNSLRPDRLCFTLVTSTDDDIIHALSVASNLPSNQLWLMDPAGEHTTRYVAMEKLLMIRSNESEFSSIHSVGHFGNRYETVIPFGECTKFNW